MNEVMEQITNKSRKKTDLTFVHYKMDLEKKEKLMKEYYKKLFITIRAGISSNR